MPSLDLNPSLDFSHFLSISSTLTQNLTTLGELLVQKNWLCATAESCTGGLLGACITSIAGASAWFSGGIMAYANAIKVTQLNVPSLTLLHDGAVSAKCVEAMAQGLCEKFTVDVGMSISGIAGPDGGSDEKPVGTVWLGFCVDGVVSSKLLQLKGNREQIRMQAVERAIETVLKCVETSRPLCNSQN